MNLKPQDIKCEYRKNPVGIDELNPRISWKIKTEGRNFKQKAYRLQVAENKKFVNPIWDTGKVKSEQSIHLEYQGPTLQSKTRYYYRVKIWDNKNRESLWSDINFWEMGLLDSGAWEAEWITPDLERDPDKYEPCPLLRNEFQVKKEVKSARLYVTGLGLYEVYLNGQRVGDYYFTPGWTSYQNRIQYQTYDIGDIIKHGGNALGVILGDGWYKGDLMSLGEVCNRNIFGESLVLLLQLHIVYENGEEEVVTSGEDWRSTLGPIRKSEIYHGEEYDARLEKENWTRSEFNDDQWSKVKVINKSKDCLRAQINEPVMKMEEITPEKIIETPAGETVIDMGQNMVGRVKFTVTGETGERVVLKHAEVLDKEGNFYTENLRSAKQKVEYHLKGEGQETYEPHFTFQGFRYVKVVDYPGEITIDNFKGIVLYSGMEKTGTFECSHPGVNQLQENIVWSQKGNFLDIPTDCPQRDERLGWTGDAQVFIGTSCFNMNTALFFTKWLGDLKADQLENGGIPPVIPSVLDGADSSSAWGDAATICPWTIYLAYNDKRILEKQYSVMKSWVEYIRRQGENEYLWETGHHFGDWLALDAEEGSSIGATDREYIATAFYAYSTGLLKQVAEILKKKEDLKEYTELEKMVKKKFRQEFVTPRGRLAVPTQTACVLALKFDLVREKDRQRVIKTLVKYIKNNDNHLTTGFVGTPYLCHVLSNNGYNELAYKLLQQDDLPSWLYPITKGATTIWEHWDGIKEDGSFSSATMNSFNHYAYGAIGDWLYRIVAGLNLDEEKPGYKHIMIAPHPGPGLGYAKASLKSMYGTIKSGWEKEKNEMKITVSVPPNTTATVILPKATLATVKEGEKSIKEQKIEGITDYKDLDNNVKLEIGSGNYCFNYKI
ncbi:MAG: family 78 glycoside hydrolase catalytic domain [bacterium]